MTTSEGQSRRLRIKHIPCLLLLQAILILLFAFFVEYDSPAVYQLHPKKPVEEETPLDVGNDTATDDHQAAIGNDHGHPSSDVNTLGHYYPSRSHFYTTIYFLYLPKEIFKSRRCFGVG